MALGAAGRSQGGADVAAELEQVLIGIVDAPVPTKGGDKEGQKSKGEKRAKKKSKA